MTPRPGVQVESQEKLFNPRKSAQGDGLRFSCSGNRA